MNLICSAVVFLTPRYLQVAYLGEMCVTLDDRAPRLMGFFMQRANFTAGVF